MPAITPGKGIRYPLFSEAGDPQAVMAMVFDLDTMATADDALRATALTRRGARITNTTAPNITKSVYTKLTYDTVNWDPLGLTNLGVNNDRFTIPAGLAGLWMFGVLWTIDNAGSGGLAIFSGEATVAKNTTVAPAVPNYRRHKYPGFTGGASGTVDCLCTAPMVMAVGDFVTSGVFWQGTAAGPAVNSVPHIFWAFPLALS